MIFRGLENVAVGLAAAVLGLASMGCGTGECEAPAPEQGCCCSETLIPARTGYMCNDAVWECESGYQERIGAECDSCGGQRRDGGRRDGGRDIVDGGARDAGGSDAQRADGGQPRDAGRADADLGGCSSWSAWLCTGGGGECRATCGGLEIDCTTTDCECDLGSGLRACGDPGGDDCARCRAMLTAPCCF